MYIEPSAGSSLPIDIAEMALPQRSASRPPAPQDDVVGALSQWGLSQLAGQAPSLLEKLGGPLAGWAGRGLEKVSSALSQVGGKALDALGGAGKLVGGALSVLSGKLDTAKMLHVALSFVPVIGQAYAAISSLPFVGPLVGKIVGTVAKVLDRIPIVKDLLKGVAKVANGIGKAVGGFFKKVGGFLKGLFK